MEYKDKLGVSVGVLLDEQKGEVLDWVKSVVSNAISERKAWEAESEARRALTAETAGPDAGPDAEASPESEKPPFICKFHSASD